MGRDDAVALTFGGFSLAYVAGDLDDGAALIDQALALNPNLAAAWSYSGWIRTYRGEMELAIEHQVRAMRLSPLDALMFNMQGGAAPLPTSSQVGMTRPRHSRNRPCETGRTI